MTLTAEQINGGILDAAIKNQHIAPRNTLFQFWKPDGGRDGIFWTVTQCFGKELGHMRVAYNGMRAYEACRCTGDFKGVGLIFGEVNKEGSVKDGKILTLSDDLEAQVSCHFCESGKHNIADLLQYLSCAHGFDR